MPRGQWVFDHDYGGKKIPEIVHGDFFGLLEEAFATSAEAYLR